MSDGVVNQKNIKKKLSRKQRDLCNSRVSNRLRQSGSLCPDDDFEATENSGEESCGKSGSCKRKVKSGAKVKVRPVLKTELWPHTIANESDGEDIDSESIGLSKFLKCYTTIMLECTGVQSEGRTALLNAIFTVFEVLQWPEARAFHNLTMLKLEWNKVG